MSTPAPRGIISPHVHLPISKSQTPGSSRIVLEESFTSPDEIEDEVEQRVPRWHVWYLAVLGFVNGNVGLLLIIGAQLCFSSMNVAVKVLNTIDPPVSPFELIVIRMSITYIFSMVYMLSAKVPDPWLGPKGVRLLLIFRGFSGFFGLFGIYYSLQYLSISDATALTFLAPLCISIAGAIFLKEKYSIAQALASIFSLAGVVLIARPSFLFDATITSATFLVNEAFVSRAPVDPSKVTPEQRMLAVGVSMLGVLGATGAYISITAMGKRAHPLHAMVSFAVQSVFVAIVGMVVTKTPIVVPTDIRWISMLFMIGVFGFAAQGLLTMGLQRESAGRGSIAIYTQIVFATILERIFFKAVPSALSVTGTLIIVSSALYVAATKRRDATITKKKSNVRLGGLSEGILEEGLLDELLGAHVAEEQDHGVQTDDRKFLVARKRDHKNEMVLPNSRVPTEEAKLLSENTASAS